MALSKFLTVPATLLVSVTMVACSSTTTSPNAAGAPLGQPVEAGVCTFPLVKLQTGPSSSCGGDSAHLWPVGMAATDCHGWQAVDTNGKLHNNSANKIACNADGSFGFVQYAGVLDCSGTGTTKSYKLNACTQDTPPSLYTAAVDLTCCSDPNAAACTKGVPSVSTAGATVYFNNQLCAK